jgi:hypothetical protein
MVAWITQNPGLVTLNKIKIRDFLTENIPEKKRASSG